MLLEGPGHQCPYLLPLGSSSKANSDLKLLTVPINGRKWYQGDQHQANSPEDYLCALTDKNCFCKGYCISEKHNHINN